MILSDGEIIETIQAIAQRRHEGIERLLQIPATDVIYRTIIGPWGKGITRTYLERWRKGYRATQALDAYLYSEFNRLFQEGKLLQ